MFNDYYVDDILVIFGQSFANALRQWKTVGVFAESVSHFARIISGTEKMKKLFITNTQFNCSIHSSSEPPELLRRDLGHKQRDVRDAARVEEVRDGLEDADGTLPAERPEHEADGLGLSLVSNSD